MATIYSAGELVELPPPAVTASATIRSSAYLAGHESRRTSILPAVYSPDAWTPSHIRSRTRSSMSMHSSAEQSDNVPRAPTCPLPSSPLPSPMPATFDHLRVLPVDVGLGTRVSEFSMNGFSEETIEAFRIFPQPGQQPNQRLSDSE
ncbi:hypothetical protein A0H81_11042 [Grifola frondosa]|uniref:Uncharacterized protein n=1 Tax=Grifola frondosa TaxID=5627 RepID=A0A1C7LVZ6_GRIFR|nr:hypothetical protein A0H81_11042 [Grifola frondosa]